MKEMEVQDAEKTKAQEEGDVVATAKFPAALNESDKTVVKGPMRAVQATLETFEGAYQDWSAKRAESNMESMQCLVRMGPGDSRQTWRILCNLVIKSINCFHLFNFFRDTLKTYIIYSKKFSTTTGFEPMRAQPNRFLVYRLNHSATLPRPRKVTPSV